MFCQSVSAIPTEVWRLPLHNRDPSATVINQPGNSHIPADPEDPVIRNSVTLAVVLAFSSMLSAGNWPAWRGPTGQGHCDEKNVPLKWSDKQNVKWKVPLKDPGYSTPIVW